MLFRQLFVYFAKFLLFLFITTHGVSRWACADGGMQS